MAGWGAFARRVALLGSPLGAAAAAASLRARGRQLWPFPLGCVLWLGVDARYCNHGGMGCAHAAYGAPRESTWSSSSCCLPPCTWLPAASLPTGLCATIVIKLVAVRLPSHQEVHVLRRTWGDIVTGWSGAHRHGWRSHALVQRRERLWLRDARSGGSTRRRDAGDRHQYVHTRTHHTHTHPHPRTHTRKAVEWTGNVA